MRQHELVLKKRALEIRASNDLAELSLPWPAATTGLAWLSSAWSSITELGPQVCLLSQVGSGSAVSAVSRAWQLLGSFSPSLPCLPCAISHLPGALGGQPWPLPRKLRFRESHAPHLGPSPHRALGLRRRSHGLPGDSRVSQISCALRRTQGLSLWSGLSLESLGFRRSSMFPEPS